ncbi:hypothetical protein [Nocardia sp. NPDC058633]|uniref:hypothetical protein n=1 Tax=Nocardia sp. NPDC058633 TaxID=3346568 RepID=UPI00364C6032
MSTGTPRTPPRAAFLADLGRTDDAIAAYTSALLLTDNAVERAHLRYKLAAPTR